MTRRGNAQHFAGVHMQITGEDNRLNEVLDELYYVAGVVVDDRKDIENQPDTGILFIQCNAARRPIVVALAEKHGLQVT